MLKLPPISAAILSILLFRIANAQVFSPIANGSTPNPVSGGLFNPDTANSRPSIDGSNIVFRNLNSSKPELFSFDGTNFHRLASTSSLLPGLSANALSTVDQGAGIG